MSANSDSTSTQVTRVFSHAGLVARQVESPRDLGIKAFPVTHAGRGGRAHPARRRTQPPRCVVSA